MIGSSIANDGPVLNIGDHQPAPKRWLVQRNLFRASASSAGSMWVNGSGVGTGKCLHNTFQGPAYIFISLRYYAAGLTVRDNANRASSAGPSAHTYVDRVGGGVHAIDTKYAAWNNGAIRSPRSPFLCLANADKGWNGTSSTRRRLPSSTRSPRS